MSLTKPCVVFEYCNNRSKHLVKVVPSFSWNITARTRTAKAVQDIFIVVCSSLTAKGETQN